MIGNKLGPYEISEEIGKGGMATVYRAYQPNMERHVAVKVIRASILSDELVRDRFQREAKLIAKLEHPHLLPVYDFNGKDNPPYIVMRFLEGGTLKQVMKAEKLPQEEMMYMLRQVASALDYAHRQGVVHRDLKPSNIMIDREGNAFIADFGIARVSDLEEELTGTGVTMGTPGYMAPEQAKGEENIDQRADIYSLGVIVYEMLAGKAPYERGSSLEILMAHLNESVPDITEDNPELSEAVSDVIKTAMAKDKAERYQTAGEFVQELSKALKTKAIENPAQLREMTESFAVDQLVALQEQAEQTKTPSDQQRQMTALYLDVTDFTELAQQGEEPDAARTLVDGLWGRLEEIAKDYGGTYEGRTGDAGMILWGREETQESDPEQAILAGLAMQGAITQTATEKWGDSEEPAPFKAGITTGPVLLTREGDTETSTASGVTITLATRLKESAPPGTVLLSHDTYSHVRGVFDLEQLPPIRMRGRSEPLDVYVALQARPRAFRLQTRGIEGVETKMIGREPELKVLQDALTLTMEDQEAQVVTVVGEAGVGKSRLLYEFSNWIDLQDQHYWYFEARATQPSMLQPYSLTRDLFSARFEIADNDPLPLVREKFEQGVAGFLGEGSQDKAHLMGQLVGFDFSDSPVVETALKEPERFQKEASKHLSELFTSAAEKQPVTVQVEDIHWADERSLDLLNSLARENTEIPLFIINMARPEIYERRPSWGEGQEFHARIMLKPLSRLDSRRLVRELLKKIKEVPTELRDLIIERMEGNPFYAEELVKVLIDDGVIKKGKNRWTVDMSKLGTVRVPPTLTGVLQARLDRLPSGEQFLLQRASVVGRIFWESAAAQLSAADGLSAGAVEDMLGDLRQREMIFKREETAFEGTNEYVFRHAILRDVVYENIVPKQRRKYHKLTAEWLEEAGRDRLDEYRMLIAEHYEAAGEVVLAAEHLLVTGTAFGNIGGLDESLRILEKGLALLDEKKHAAERLPLQLQIATILAVIGDYDGAKARLEPSLKTARRLKDRESEARALSELGRITGIWQGEYEIASKYFEEALPIIKELNDDRFMAFILRQLGNLASASSDLDVGERYLMESLELARETNQDGQQYQALNSLGNVYSSRDEFEKSLETFQEGLEIAEKIGDRSGMAMVTSNISYIHIRLENLEEAKKAANEALALATEIGSDWLRGSGLILLGTISIREGHFELAKDQLKQSLAISWELGNIPNVLGTLAEYSRVAAQETSHEKAFELLGLVSIHPALDELSRQVIEDAMEALKGGLSEKEQKAAMKRGEKLDLEAVVQEVLGA